MPRARKTRSTAIKTSDSSEFPLQLRLRIEYAGKWVAWDEEMYRVVAATDEFETLEAAAKQAGFDRFVVEWLPPLDEAWPTGGL